MLDRETISIVIILAVVAGMIVQVLWRHWRRRK